MTCRRIGPGVAAFVHSDVWLILAVLLLVTRNAAAQDGSLIAPARRGGYAFASAEAFAFAGDGSVAGGGLGAGYVASVPVRAELGMKELAFASANDRSSKRASFFVYAGLDTHLFGVGPSVGYLSNDRLETPSFGAALRVGAVDGLHLQARVMAGTEPEQILYPAQGPFPEPEERVVWAELDARLQVPVARGHALLATLYATPGPYARLALGYRGRLSKLERRDSSWIEVKAGLGLMDSTFADSCNDCQTFIAGPLFGVGFEQRF